MLHHMGEIELSSTIFNAGHYDSESKGEREREGTKIHTLTVTKMT